MKSGFRVFILISILVVLLLSAQSHAEVEKKYSQKTREASLAVLMDLKNAAADQQIAGIELWLAAPKGVAESSFGHTFLRFVKKQGDFAADPVLGFYAEIGEVNLNLLNKLIIGTRMLVPKVLPQFGVLPLVRSVAEIWNEYVNGEQREIRRYIISADPQRVFRVLETVTNYFSKNDMGYYNFFTQNCGQALNRILVESGIGVGSAMRPAGLPNVLFENGVSVLPPLTIAPRKGLLKKLSALLKQPEDEISLLKTKPETLIENLSKEELQYVLHDFPFISSKVRREIKKHIGDSTISYDQLLGVVAVPAQVYGLCQDQECANEIWRASHSLWSAQEVLTAMSLQKRLLSYFPLNEKNSDYWTHLLKLTTATGF